MLASVGELRRRGRQAQDVVPRTDTPASLESLREIGKLSSQPVEGFLRTAPGTVSRDDVMLEVLPKVQREIAEAIGREIPLDLRVAPFVGAGRFQRSARDQVLESAGFRVKLSEDVEERDGGELHIVGRVEPSAP